MSTSKRTIRAYWLGPRRYQVIHALQERLLLARQQGRIGDTLLLLEHGPVITMGRGARPENVLLSPSMLEARGVELVTTDRGGDVTYHGPGQLVGYPIVGLEPDRCDVRRYVRDLIETMVGLARDHGVSAGVLDKYPGVWVDVESPRHWPGQDEAKQPAKLGAVGIRISRWVTMHGFAFNACTSLEGFGLIVPCGIQQFDVTTLHELVGGTPQPKALAPRAAELLSERMEADLERFSSVEVSDNELEEALGVPSDVDETPAE